MSDEYVPLVHYLRPAKLEPPPPTAPPPAPAVPYECAEALAAARRFHAGISDAMDAALPQLLRAIADDVLARELQLGDVEIGAIAKAALDRFTNEQVISIRAHPKEVDRLRGLPLESIADDELERGDLHIELRSGTIELSLQARVEAVLAAWD